MFLDPVEGFLTMRNAADALYARLRVLRDEARIHGDTLNAERWQRQLREVEILVAAIDPDDIFEQDTYRRLFTDELTTLT